MTQKTKLRWLSVVQIVMALLMFPVFFCWALWQAAQTREEALQWYPSVTIPSDWKAVTMDHGTIHQWRLGTISLNPVGFTLCTLLLATILGVLFWSIWFSARLKGFKKGQYY